MQFRPSEPRYGTDMPQVMVVDDSAFVRMKAREILSDCGYSVVEAVSGTEAVDVYKTQAPDCVLLDITMPDTDGLTALAQIREYDPDARIAMVTRISEQRVVIKALEAGAMDFVVKPFTKGRMTAAVRKMIG